MVLIVCDLLPLYDQYVSSSYLMLSLIETHVGRVCDFDPCRVNDHAKVIVRDSTKL